MANSSPIPRYMGSIHNNRSGISSRYHSRLTQVTACSLGCNP